MSTEELKVRADVVIVIVGGGVAAVANFVD
jgi:hypothetical protein